MFLSVTNTENDLKSLSKFEFRKLFIYYIMCNDTLKLFGDSNSFDNNDMKRQVAKEGPVLHTLYILSYCSWLHKALHFT